MYKRIEQLGPSKMFYGRYRYSVRNIRLHGDSTTTTPYPTIRVHCNNTFQMVVGRLDTRNTCSTMYSKDMANWVLPGLCMVPTAAMISLYQFMVHGRNRS